jgi:lysozyme family protein
MPTTDNFDACLAFALRPENDGQPYHVTPGDPGGATAWGVIQTTYDDYRDAHDLHTQSVKLMTPAERSDIYHSTYWTSGLPRGVDLMVFDFAVTSGPGRSRKFLQAAVGAPADGEIGPQSRAAVAKHAPAELVKSLAAHQLAFYRSLPTFHLFGGGWTNRTDARKAAALKMVSP